MLHQFELLTPAGCYSGMHCVFLPPYSPDYNPIELAFSAVKAHIRRHRHEFLAAMANEDSTDIYLALVDAVYSITPQDALGWFRRCSYV
jgi:hypothetical protein